MRRDCRQAQERILGVLAGTLDQRSRVALDEHAMRCLRCSEALRDAMAAHVAFDRAFAVLRSRRTSVAPGRARLAAAPVRVRPRLGGAFATVRHLSEATVALGVSVFVLSGVMGTVPRAELAGPEAPRGDFAPLHVSPSRGFDDAQFFYRWVRIGRYAPPQDTLDPTLGLLRSEDDAPAPATYREGALH